MEVPCLRACAIFMHVVAIHLVTIEYLLCQVANTASEVWITTETCVNTLIAMAL